LIVKGMKNVQQKVYHFKHKSNEKCPAAVGHRTLLIVKDCPAYNF